MNNLLGKNKKGIVLVSWYFVLVLLVGLSAVAFMRSTSNLRLAQRNRYAMEAFCEAEAGLNYAYVELSRQGFSWYTHEDKDTPVTTSRLVSDEADGTVGFTYPVPVAIESAFIDAGTGYYCLNDANGNRRFQLKAYPERDADDNFTGIVTVLSQAEVSGVSRTIEYRLGQDSVYEYFFFFPKDHDFKAATFDGRNYGGIHVNGDINLAGWPDPKFYFLTKLTSGSDLPDKGFILRPRRSGFPDLHGEVAYGGSASYPFALSWGFYSSVNSRFALDNTYIRTGEYPKAGIPDEYTQTILYPYLDSNLYPGAEWPWDRYEGDGSNTTPAHYNISDQNLKNAALYEMCGHTGRIPLLDNNNIITINPGDGSDIKQGPEADLFEAMYNDPETQTGLWAKFWEKWKDNHKNDYYEFHCNTGTLTGGEDWERRFFLAIYEWVDGNESKGIPDDGIPLDINREWWEDLSYADDRLSLTNDMSPAQYEDRYSGEKLDWYILNTKEQPAAWATWLTEHNFNEAGENQTLIQDRSQGGRYLDPGDVLSEQHSDSSAIKQRAQQGGIYIGLNEQGIFANPLENICTVDTTFYNAAHPAGHYARHQAYTPSNFMVLDVHALKEALEDLNSSLNQNYLQGNFNGVIYIDLAGYIWPNTSYSPSDPNAEGVMLVNGEILPQGGLSVVASNNVLIKGNYNLDPDGRTQKNRDPDDAQVITRATDPSQVDYTPHYSRIDNTEYFVSEDQLEWQPADVISKRAVYTLSEDFPEPQYMPMASGYYYQYIEEREGHVPSQAAKDLVSGDPNYPTNSWVPDVNSTRQINPTVDLWFERYYTGTVPANWSVDWVGANWPIDGVFSLDTDGDSQPDTYLLGRDLRTAVTEHIQAAYEDEFSFETIHGSDGSENPYTDSLINKVSKKQTYNAAIVTPYNTSSDVLEYWQVYDPDLDRMIGTPRVINGAFIQLPDEFANQVCLTAYYTRVKGPEQADIFNYESRFGRGAHTSDRPPAGLVFGADCSWREIKAENF